MVSESFGLVRIRYYFLKKKEYIFIYSLILVTFDRFLFHPFYSTAPQTFFHQYSNFLMMSKGERIASKVVASGQVVLVLWASGISSVGESAL